MQKKFFDVPRNKKKKYAFRYENRCITSSMIRLFLRRNVGITTKQAYAIISRYFKRHEKESDRSIIIPLKNVSNVWPISLRNTPLTYYLIMYNKMIEMYIIKAERHASS